MNGPGESAKTSPPDSQQEIPIFHLCVPSALKESLQGLIFTDVFNTLKEKYGLDQERFTVRIHSQEGWSIPELLDKASKKEMDIFIGQMMYTKGTQNQLDKAGFRHKNLAASSVEVLIWNPDMEKRRFLEELSLKLADETILKKYNIINQGSASDLRRGSFILAIPPALKSLVEEVVSDTVKTLAGRNEINQKDLTVQIKSNINTPEDIQNELASGRRVVCISPFVLLDKGAKKFFQKKIGTAAVGVICSKQLTGLTDLTSHTLVDILAGKIGDWAQISKELNGKIIIYTPAQYAIQLRLLLDRRTRETLKIIEEGTVLETINEVAQNKNSLGIIPLVDIARLDLSRVNLLSIDEISPADKKSIERYSCTITYHLIYNQDIATHPFLKELTNKLDEDATLRKYNIHNYLVISAVVNLVGPLNSIISGIFNNSNDKDKKYTRRFIVKDKDRYWTKETSDIVISGEPSRQRLFGKADFSIQQIGKHALVVITSKSTANPINLSTGALKDILSGKIDDWSKISPDLNGKIVVYTDYEPFIQTLLKMDESLKCVEKLPAEVITKVAEDENILGVIRSEGINEAEKKGLHLVLIDGISPREAGEYPYFTPIYLMYNNALESDEILQPFLKEFRNALINENTLKELGIWK